MPIAVSRAVSGAHVGPAPPPNVASIEKWGRGRMPARGDKRRRRHRDVAAESKDGDATPELLFLERTAKALPQFLLDEERKKASASPVF